MVSPGVVRRWTDDEGWGVIDGDDVPGGCWAHFSVLRIAGYRALSPGAAVEFEWERAEQEGFAYRATAAWPAGSGPVDTARAIVDRPVMRSVLTIAYDGDPDAG